MASKWDELERWMEGQKLPKGFEVLREPDWVEQFVRKLMTKALPDAAGVMPGPPPSVSTFETHHFVIVKFKLPPGTRQQDLQLLVKSDKVKIQGLPEGKTETVKLPAPVLPRKCRALAKDGILQIKLRKRLNGNKYIAADIRWE
ncbi:Hsp20/alpha crystallin family protein [Paenibacillus thailandensis]|uniref:Hsp20/alpha crystallin family protein n=1 Tax=Paenibacillus thailandensis TaxID=393250 RepID=A0ABW5QYY1_9BACL